MGGAAAIVLERLVWNRACKYVEDESACLLASVMEKQHFVSLCWYFTRWLWRFNAEVGSRFANIHDSRLRGLCAAVSGHTSAHSAARVQWGAHHRRVAIVRATLLLKVQLGGQFQLLSRRARRDLVLALADVVSLAGNNFTDVGQVHDTYSADGNDVAVADAVTSARLAVYSAHDHVDALPATTSANVHPAVDTATANSVRDPSLPLQGVGTPVPCMPLRLSFNVLDSSGELFLLAERGEATALQQLLATTPRIDVNQRQVRCRVVSPRVWLRMALWLRRCAGWHRRHCLASCLRQASC